MNNVSVPHITQSAADHFRLASATLPGDSKVLELRTNAMERFVAKGFPLKSDEEYKYSGTEKILKDEILWTPEIEPERVIDFDTIRNLHLRLHNLPDHWQTPHFLHHHHLLLVP